jgi:atypical dual specificity phosphatase
MDDRGIDNTPLKDGDRGVMVLPQNFCFIWENRVAGSAFPGTGRTLAERLASLREQGIHAILSATREMLDLAILREFEMGYCHLPVEDMTSPSQSQIREAVAFIDAELAQGHGVLIHCRAGIGRTGTLLACFLVSRGYEADQAILEVRRLRPGSLEVYAQEYCVYQYARSLREQPPPGDNPA